MDSRRTCVLLSLALLGLYLVLYTYFRTPFWDLETYARAINDSRQSVDPYRTNVRELFVYHPYVLAALVAMDGWVPIRIALGAFYAATTGCFCWRLASVLQDQRRPEGSVGDLWAVLLGSTVFGGIGVLSIATGNVTVFLHFAILSLVLGCLRVDAASDSRLWQPAFMATVVASSLIKPYLLGYLALLFVLRPPRQALMLIAFLCLIAAAVWVSGFYVDRTSFDGFLAALDYQVLSKGDAGYSVFGLLLPLFGPRVSLICHMLITAAFAVAGFLLISRVHKNNSRTLLGLLTVVFIILINPRMKEYDFYVAVLLSYLLGYLILFNRVWRGMLISLVIVSALTLLSLSLGSIAHIQVGPRFQLLGLMVFLAYVARELASARGARLNVTDLSADRMPP